MKLKTFILELFKDERGRISIKPVVATIGTIFLCGTMAANSFSSEDVKPSDGLVDAVMAVTIAAMLGDTGDKFSLRKKEEPMPTEETIE